MKRKGFSLPMLGGASLLTVFAVLCLVMFALLSLSTARSQANFAQTSADSVSAYYAADARAEAILARLRAGERPPEVREEEDLLAYTCPISDTQALEVLLEPAGADYAILRWQAVSTVEWTSDESLDVWDGIIP